MRHLVPLATLCTLTCVSLAHAQPAERTVYELSGQDSTRGPFASSIAVDARVLPGQVEVVRVVRYRGERQGHMQRGFGKLVDGKVVVTLRDSLGASGHVSGEATTPSTELVIAFRPDGSIEARGTSAAGDSVASSRPVAAPPAAEGRHGLTQKGKHLLAVGKDALRKRLRKERDKLVYERGVSVSEDFALSRFLHIGVGGKVRALRDAELTPGQVYTSRQQPDTLWLVSKVHGGARVPLSTSIPVGEVSVGVGLELGARVDYEVTDIYPRPAGFNRDGLGTLLEDLEQMADRSFDLPIDAAEAQAMNIGAIRVLDGEASVAVSGSISLGHEVANIDDVVRIGASARLGGFYRLQGDLHFTVERLLGDRVRLRVRRGETTSRGADAELFLGATVGKNDMRDEVQPLVEYVDEALVDTTHMPTALREALVDAVEGEAARVAADTVNKVLRIRIRGAVDKTLRDEVDLSYVFDLSKPQAREAYERGVRGDLTRAAALTLEPGAGVEQEFRVLEVEERTYLGVDLDLSVVLRAKASREIRLTNLSIDDPRGVRGYEIFRFNRTRRLSFFSRDRKKSLDVEVIRRAIPGRAGEDVARTLRLNLDVLDPSTFKREGERVRRLISSWGLNASSDLPEPERRFLHSRYGETRLQVKLEISEEGLQGLLSADAGQLMQAYVRGYTALEGEQPRWATPEGRAEVLWERNHRENNSGNTAESQMLEAADDFVQAMRDLAGARTQEERADFLKALAKSAKFDHYVLAALVELTPREHLRLDASFLGERVRIVDGREGSGTLVNVIDPRVGAR